MKNMKTVLEMARELGAAIQADKRFIDTLAAKEANDNDKDLQAEIGEFNLARMNLNVEMGKNEEEKDSAKISKMNDSIKEQYEKIMSNPLMTAFSDAKDGMDQMINEVNIIIEGSLNGENPYEIDPSEEKGCSGSCSSCNGCH